MAFLEEQFPTSISYGSSGGPKYSTTIATVNSGFEQRNINWTDARCEYIVNQAVRTEQQINELVAFFRTVKGMGIGFRYKDWTDYKATGEALGVGDGIMASFQMKKVYTFGTGATYDRIIKKPVAGSISVYVDGILDGTATVDITTGIITFPVAPVLNSIITADFEFDVPARFGNDSMNITLDFALISTWSNITVLEIR